MRIRSKIRRFKVRVTVASPVCISSGNSYGILDYAFKGDKVLIIDYDKLLKSLTLTEREELKRIINLTGLEAIWRVREFLSKKATSKVAKDSIELSPKARDKIERSIQKKSINKLEIEQTIKEGNIPFIPGSSLKGALRTAILDAIAEELLKSEKRPDWLNRIIEEINEAIAQIGKDSQKDGKNILRRKSRELEEWLLCKLKEKTVKELKQKLKLKSISPTAGDPFRFIKVSDLFPVNKAKRKIRVLERKSISTLAEFIEEGVFEGSIIVDEGQLKTVLEEIFKCSLKFEPTKEGIVSSLRKHFSHVFSYEKQFIGDIPPILIKGTVKELVQRYNTEEGKKSLSIIKLGKFSGALAKTFKSEELRKIYNRKSETYQSEPTTAWLTEEKKIPGWCFIELEDAD